MIAYTCATDFFHGEMINGYNLINIFLSKNTETDLANETSGSLVRS
jgi:hypothetical protein